MIGDFMAGADIIPVDMAVSLIIAVAWSTAMERFVFVKKYYILFIDMCNFAYLFVEMCYIRQNWLIIIYCND